MAEKVFPKGVVVFPKHEKAPDFVGETVIINMDVFREWINGEGRQYLTDYKNDQQLKLQINTGKDGKKYCVVDTYKKGGDKTTTTNDENYTAKEQETPAKNNSVDDDLPF